VRQRQLAGGRGTVGVRPRTRRSPWASAMRIGLVPRPRPWTCSAAGASCSASAPAGTAPSSTRSASPARSGPAAPWGRRRDGV